MSEIEINSEVELNSFVDKSVNYLYNAPIDSVVIKGHILLEEHIDEIILLASNSDFDLSKTNFTFRQKIDILGILGILKKSNREYEILTKYNSIRNKFAHKLEVDRTSIDSLINIAPWENKKHKSKRIETDEQRAMLLSMLLFSITGVLSGITEVKRLAKTDLNKLGKKVE